jgi:hypothetical protein
MCGRNGRRDERDSCRDGKIEETGTKLMNEAERDKAIYDLAKHFLLQLGVADVTPSLVEKYLQLSQSNPRPKTIAGIYQRILESAQNANMKAAVVGRAIGGVNKLGLILCNFEPKAVLKKYSGWELILNDVERFLKPVGKIRRTPRSIWPQYCQAILSGARFMSQFQTADDFYNWVSFFDNDSRARPALPMLLANEIEGFGFALASDFLKELGFINFAKPDVHLRDIFIGLNLCSAKANDYEVFKAVVRLANNAGVSPYNADKIFWLIGSGYFYDDTHIGDKGRIGSHKAKFIAYAKAKLV